MAVALRNSATAAATSLRAVDLLLLGYLGLVTVVAVIRASHQPGFWLLLLGHALFVVFLFLLTRPGHGRVGRTVREIYPLFLLPALYAELDILNTPLGPVYDNVVQEWELLLFGSQISREWWQAAPSRFWSTTLHAAYLSYYFIVSVPGLYFAWQGNLDAVRRFVLVVITTFIVCYIVFIFFPVAGPYYTFPPPSPWFTDNFAARLVYQALETGSSYGAAFPSSHVAAALAATISASRVSNRLGLVLMFPTLLLTVGVVYCQMHYGVDALAGIILGVAMAWVFRGEIRKTARKEARN